MPEPQERALTHPFSLDDDYAIHYIRPGGVRTGCGKEPHQWVVEKIISLYDEWSYQEFLDEITCESCRKALIASVEPVQQDIEMSQ